MATREACEVAGGSSADQAPVLCGPAACPGRAPLSAFHRIAREHQPWGQKSWDEFGAQLKGRCWAWPASSALCNFTGPSGSSGLGNGSDARLFCSGMFPLTLE